MTSTYEDAADANADRAQQLRLLAALGAWDRALRRDELAAWCIRGTGEHLHLRRREDLGRARRMPLGPPLERRAGQAGRLRHHYSGRRRGRRGSAA